LSAEQFGAHDEGGLSDESSPRAEDIETPFFTRTISPSGAVIGSYRLLATSGHGGMGEVWLADQKQPVRRRVAIKLIKAGRTS
jgi:hypothetical protein